MKKRILVTGSGGFVAGSVIVQAQQDWEVHGAGRSEPVQCATGVRYHVLDILDKSQLSNLFYNIKPDAVIHTAAIADIDYCQKHQEIAEIVNTGITRTLAGLCADAGAKLVFCSTDTVFDGKKGFYTEADEPNPVNFYANTKIKAEQIVKKLGSAGVIARLSLVMGLPVMGKGNSFLATMMGKLKSGDSMKFAENEIRTPIDVITLGMALIELAGNTFSGIMHLGGNSRLTRYEMARQIAAALRYSPGLINAVNSNAFEGRAPRPDDASLDNSLARQVLHTPMLSLREGLGKTINFRPVQKL